jgi:hypothetical protein
MKSKLFYGKIEGGKIICGGEFDLYKGFLEGKEIEIKISKRVKNRTETQNNALHLLFKQLSDEMIEKGLDLKVMFDRVHSVEATPEMIKIFWKKLQKALINKSSTTQLNKTGDIERVYDNFNRILIDVYKGEVSLPAWPSVDNLFINKTK